MNFASLNFTAALVGAVIAMAIGMYWYSPYGFGKQWIAGLGLSEHQIAEGKKKNMKKVYGMALVNSLVMVAVLNILINELGVYTVGGGIATGLFVAIGFCATSLFSGVLWEGKKLNVFFINAGYYAVLLMILGALFAKW